jgi:hypothetical protein
MKGSNRRLWLFGAIAIGALILLTLFAAPANNKLSSGSTYTRAPNGYGAWYAFMDERGTPVKRWQKRFENLANNKTIQTPATLLRVNSQLSAPELNKGERDWVEKGNTLVFLGIRQPVTKAAFNTLHETAMGQVKINTARRNLSAKEKQLGDRFGSIVWQENIGKGRIIFATTPDLAANAYQDFRGNYEFLAQLVTQSEETKNSSIQNSLWVDEYLHGYTDKEATKGKQEQDIFSYFSKTPVFPALIQVAILLLVAIWAGNRRFGKPETLPTPVVNNSEAYIQALAAVLQKAESSEFVLEVMGKEEQVQLQKALFLGQEQLDPQSLVNAWMQQTGRPAAELEQVLQMQSQKARIRETELLKWLGKWQQIRRHLPFSNP